MHHRTHELHAQHVGLLARYVLGAHVHVRFKAHEGAGDGGGHAVLARAGFGHKARLAHAFG